MAIPAETLPIRDPKLKTRHPKLPTTITITAPGTFRWRHRARSIIIPALETSAAAITRAAETSAAWVGIITAVDLTAAALVADTTAAVLTVGADLAEDTIERRLKFGGPQTPAIL